MGQGWCKQPAAPGVRWVPGQYSTGAVCRECLPLAARLENKPVENYEALFLGGHLMTGVSLWNIFVNAETASEFSINIFVFSAAN